MPNAIAPYRRVHRGQRAGGQFASVSKADADTVLDTPWRSGTGTPRSNGGYTDIIDTPHETRYLRFGQYHRDGGPAHITSDGFEAWYCRGFLHRGGDLPAVTDPSGRQEWWVHGARHRVDGPAVINADGTQEWWVDGLRIPAPNALAVSAAAPHS